MLASLTICEKSVTTPLSSVFHAPFYDIFQSSHHLASETTHILGHYTPILPPFLKDASCIRNSN